MKSYLCICLFLILAAVSVQADSIELQSGVKIDGKVMKVTEEKVFLRVDQSTFTYPRNFVGSIEITKKQQVKPDPSLRLPNAEMFLDSFVAQKWVSEIRDVPATVVDVGILKNVPYMSYRCGDYEINIYGDPAKPAGVEIGVFKKLVDSEEAKRNCLAFMDSVLLHDLDRHILKALKKTEDKSTLNDLTFEITPPTAEDAYGGWWVSVYSEVDLDKSRASDDEIKSITVNKKDISKKQPVVASTPVQPSQNNPAIPPDKVVLPIVPNTTEPAWNDDDLRYARQPKQQTASTGGSVYVRGYFRKDGTYVRPHSRRK